MRSRNIIMTGGVTLFMVNPSASDTRKEKGRKRMKALTLLDIYLYEPQGLYS